MIDYCEEMSNLGKCIQKEMEKISRLQKCCNHSLLCGLAIVTLKIRFDASANVNKLSIKGKPPLSLRI